MARINVSKDDLKKSKVLSPEWYPVEIVDYKYEQNKKGDAFNHIYDFKVLSPEDCAGVVLRNWYSEKAMGMIVPLAKAMGVPVDEKNGFSFDPEAGKGRKIEVHVKNEMNEGRPRNVIDGYRPMKG